MDAWMPGCYDAQLCGIPVQARGCSVQDCTNLKANGGTLGVIFRIFFPLWGEALESLGHLLEKAWKKVPKIREMGFQSGHIFVDILSLGGK